MSILTSGISWLQSQRSQFLSEPITYQRAGFLPVTINATRGETEFAIDTGEAVRLENNQIDWIITAGDLVINGQVTVPERGDTVTTAAGIVHAVQQPDGVSQPYRFDPTGLQLRIHSHRTSS